MNCASQAMKITLNSLSDYSAQWVQALAAAGIDQVHACAGTQTDSICGTADSLDPASPIASYSSVADALSGGLHQAEIGAHVACLIDNRAGGDSQTLSSWKGAAAHGGSCLLVVIDSMPPHDRRMASDCRPWGIAASLPVIEAADAAELRSAMCCASEISREFICPVVLRLLVAVEGALPVTSARLVESGDTGGALRTTGKQGRKTIRGISASDARALARMRDLSNYANHSRINLLHRGPRRSTGYIAAGATYPSVRAAKPDATVLKIGMLNPLPMKQVRGIAEMCKHLICVEAGEPLLARELELEGVPVSSVPARLALGGQNGQGDPRK